MRRILSTLIISFLIFPFTGAAQGEQRYADGTATDQENNSFEWINYGTQDWTIENAKVETYRDGTEIPQVTDASVWANLTTGAWCYYGNDPTKGKLYNWYALMGIQDNDPNTPNKVFAPEGWHVPTDAEWTTLENYLIANVYNYDGTTTGNKIGKAMASTTGWNSSPSTGAIGNDQSLNNSSGFNAFPEGNRFNNGSFSNEGNGADFWSSTEYGSDYAWNRYLGSNYSHLHKSSGNSSLKHYGFSVRFVRDASSLGSYRDILLNGTVSAENNQIKNVAEPTDARDAATKGYVDNAGVQGEAGPQGPAGAAGADGVDGANGSDGSSAYQIWTAAGNTGTEAQFLASLVGAQGEAGPQGPAGAAGVDGANGSDGSSAYQIWTAAGNTGTEAQFLASLVGAQGEAGPQGEQGPTGPQGLEGSAGNGIASTTDNNDGTFTLNFDDGSTFTTSDLSSDISDLETAISYIPGGALNIGDFVGGGIVFWIDPTDNTKGLACALEYQSQSIQWYNGSNTVTNATATAIGSGATNTTAIIDSQGPIETDYAAGLARAFNGGGFNDWFLPSKGELSAMFQNKETLNTAISNNGGQIFQNVTYWSSTETDSDFAKVVGFGNGSSPNYHKYSNAHVRAVRAVNSVGTSSKLTTIAAEQLAQNSAIDLKAPLASPSFTGTVSGITKSMVGLANVDNTTDANKPVSTAMQTALDLKAPLASPTFTGTITAGAITIPSTDGTTGQVLATDGSGTLSWTTPSSGATTYSVGDTAQGGKVIWVDATGQHGLVVAMEDAAGSVAIDWNAGTASNGFNLETLAQSSGIYAGKMNTAIIIAAHAAAANNGNNFAARACNEYTYTQNGVTYADWYLPSKDELHLINTSGVAPNLYSYNYWSSTEYDANNAYVEVLSNYANNYNQFKPKDSPEGIKVRAIRAF